MQDLPPVGHAVIVVIFVEDVRLTIRLIVIEGMNQNGLPDVPGRQCSFKQFKLQGNEHADGHGFDGYVGTMPGVIEEGVISPLEDRDVGLLTCGLQVSLELSR